MVSFFTEPFSPIPRSRFLGHILDFGHSSACNGLILTLVPV